MRPKDSALGAGVQERIPQIGGVRELIATTLEENPASGQLALRAYFQFFKLQSIPYGSLTAVIFLVLTGSKTSLPAGMRGV